MPRNITAAQRRSQDFYKRDALAQINQIKYDCFFAYHRKHTHAHTQILSQDLKVQTKILDTFS